MSSLADRLDTPRVDLDIPEKTLLFLEPERYRYKVMHGGRGGAKSWTIARILVALAHTQKHRILCAREFQSSIVDSVYRLLVDQIYALGLERWFEITQINIISRITGSVFIFKGLRRNMMEIKSTEGITICWVEEAQLVSAENWKILIPTIREKGSEIWISFNPYEEGLPGDGSTFQRFVINPPPRSLVVQIGWEDNPWFPDVLDEERRFMLSVDIDAYEHVWGGKTLQISEAVVFRNRVSVDAFETPEGVQFFFGADFGFADDPSVLIRSFIKDDCLYIDQEAYGHHVEIDDLAKPYDVDGGLYDRVPFSRHWPIKADGSRPETISYIARQGYMISAAEKWDGSVEDGISHLKGFRKIIVHERCKQTAQEFRLYAYKTDPKTKLVLPKLIDRHNHCIDALRYSLDGYIQNRGGAALWARLGR